jgi:hypothetical protein
MNLQFCEITETFWLVPPLTDRDDYINSFLKGALAMRRSLVLLSMAGAMAFCMPRTVVWAQDFHKTYAISAGGHVRIGNISGDVKVIGYKGDSILVDGFKIGPDRNLVSVEDTSSADHIDLKVAYPERCNCDAGINFEVRVPQGIDYSFDRLASVSGNVEILSIRGRLKAESVSGNVSVKDVFGVVSASSVSGNVEVTITRMEGTGEMKFSSVSGNVNVKAPSNLEADIEMSSISGSLKTDFPIEIQERRYGPGRSARGRLGAGTNNLRITSVSGRVSLTRS